jgi:hemolysin III
MQDASSPTPPRSKRPQTLGEEIANSVIHGIGAALGVAALSVLVTFAGLFGDAWRVVSFAVYGASIVVLYTVSTLYHGFTHPRAKRVFNILDHAAIYLLIAGTYTPFTLVTLRGAWGWTLFGVIWGLAVAGIVFETVAFERFKALTVSLYVALGWIVVIAIRPLMQALPAGGLWWLLAGGLCYTGGVAFYVLGKRVRYAHAVWHLFVLGGSLCHFVCVLVYVLPMG